MKQASNHTPGSLQGIRVIEVGTSVAAPFATQILSDLGAEVIKVERLNSGDDSRQWAPPTWDEHSVAFLNFNRGKKSLALDMKSEPGKKVMNDLISSADVLIQNLRPGAFSALGFDQQTLQEINPRLIACDISGFGAVGPKAGHPAYDPLLQAYSGIVSLTGHEDGDPVRVPVSILDMGAGMWVAIAVLDALRTREVTGQGCLVETSLLQTATTWMSLSLMGALGGNPAPKPLGSGLGGVVPYGAFASADGHVFISAGNQDAWTRLCTALDAKHLLEDYRFANNSERATRRTETNAALAEVTSQLTSQNILDRLVSAKVPCAPVQTVTQLLQDPQFQAVGQLQPVEHEKIDGFQAVALPFTVNGSYPQISKAPPAVGDNSSEVLQSLGYDQSEIIRLLDEQVVQNLSQVPAT